MTTYLYRGNSQGEILDADGRVVGRIVPPEPTRDMHVAAGQSRLGKPGKILGPAYTAMLSAAPADWSEHAVRVPKRISVDAPTFKEVRLRAEGFNEALDAIMGAK